MKTKTLSIALLLISFSFMAFHSGPLYKEGECHVAPTYIDMFYVIGPRFQAITKQQLAQAKTVGDFFEEDEVQPLLNYTSVEIILIENDKRTDQKIENGFFHLSKEQIDWISGMDYETHFLVRTTFQANNLETGLTESKRAEPHFTVVPETQAAYSLGEKALIDYIAETNRKKTKIILI